MARLLVHFAPESGRNPSYPSICKSLKKVGILRAREVWPTDVILPVLAREERIRMRDLKSSPQNDDDAV